MPSAGRKRILFLYIWTESTWIRRDAEILAERYDVRKVKVTPLGYLLLPFRVMRSDLVFAWFGDLHAFFGVLWAKLFRKRSVVVAGGYDVVSMPHIRYGLQLRPFARRWSRWAFRHADLVLPVSRSIADDLARVAPLPLRKVRLVYHGMDHEAFRPAPGVKRENLVVTVGAVNASNLTRKGLLTFARASRLVPEVPWLLVGGIVDPSAKEALQREGGPNLSFAGFVPNDELVRTLSGAKVYVQPSGHEGFGASLAEAMLCGCVPVATRAGAIPEVVGETGLYVPEDDPAATAAAVREAMTRDGAVCRERIKTLFPLSKRKRELLDAVRSVLPE